MAENENMIIEEPKEKKVTWAKFKAGFKEWGCTRTGAQRKKGLRRPKKQ